MRTKFLEILLIMSLIIAGCNNIESIHISGYVNEILRTNQIYHTSIIALGDYETCSLKIDEVTVTDEEVDEYIIAQIESFSEIVEIKDRTIVEVGDVVYVSYIVCENDIVINQRQHDNLMVGSYNYDKKLEDALVGRCVGEPFIVALTTSDGKSVQVNIIIESINYFQKYELTEQLVQEKYGLSNIEEYYQMCKRNLILEKEDDARRRAEKSLFSSIIDLCEFSIDREEIAKYSMDFIQVEEDIAYVYDMDLNTYAEQILNKDIDEFYQEYYDYGEYEIKKYLVIGAIYEDLDLMIEDDEYKNMCEDVGYEYEVARTDEYLDAVIHYNIMEKKVVNYFEQK